MMKLQDEVEVKEEEGKEQKTTENNKIRKEEVYMKDGEGNHKAT